MEAVGLLPAAARQRSVVGRAAAMAPGSAPKAWRAAIPAVGVSIGSPISARIRSPPKRMAGAARSPIPARAASLRHSDDHRRVIRGRLKRHRFGRRNGSGERRGRQYKGNRLQHCWGSFRGWRVGDQTPGLFDRSQFRILRAGANRQNRRGVRRGPGPNSWATAERCGWWISEIKPACHFTAPCTV